MKMGRMYAIGHAATVAVLGSAVIVFHLSLPAARAVIACLRTPLTPNRLACLGLFSENSRNGIARTSRERLPSAVLPTRRNSYRDVRLLTKSR